MAGYVILGTLAAFGLLCVIWTAFGWLLPGLKGCAVVCVGMPSECMLYRIKWLQEMGLLNCPLLIVAQLGQSSPDLEICSGEMLLSRLEWERKRFDGTGNGDYSGHHQRGGVSEL